MNKMVLHAEYGLAFLLTLFIYLQLDFSFWLFLLLLFVPDIAMIGYIFNSTIGALFYNMGHSVVIPAILIGVAMLLEIDTLLMLSCIWLAHIFLDRCLGYGLKYKQSFKDTHMQRV